MAGQNLMKIVVDMRGDQIQDVTFLALLITLW
jgi:hypothetical protein